MPDVKSSFAIQGGARTSLLLFSARPTGGESSTGLGLSIVRELIALHGGQMIVKSVPGQGATFGFELPILAG